MITSESVTAGILAGGRAVRLGGIDKAWHVYRGHALILRTQQALAGQARSLLVSANRNQERHRSLGLQPVADRLGGAIGPLAGLDALFDACPTPWLVTVPVDLARIPDDLVARLAGGGAPNGAVARDRDGVQPLVALWPVERASALLTEVLADGQRSAWSLLRRLGPVEVDFSELHFGNLNRPEDFDDA